MVKVKPEKKGDWVCSAEFDDFRKEQTKEHKLITDNQIKTDKKLDALSPLVDLIPDLQSSVRLKKSTDEVVDNLKSKAKTVAIFLGVIAVSLTIINALKDLILFWFIKIK
jgi:hypothetical protein